MKFYIKQYYNTTIIYMSELMYKKKYLKYKNKYLELKNQQNQVGGYAYAPGQYVFFIPNRIGPLIDTIPSDKVIKSLDNFTTMLGNCTRFLRIGTNISDNKTIYTNQSSFDVSKRATGEALVEAKRATGEAYEATKKATGEAWDATKPKLEQAWDATKKTTGEAWDATKPKLEQAWDATKQGVENLSKKASDTYENMKTPKNSSQEGGENDCNKLPIPLPNDFKIPNSLYDITKETLPRYLDIINKNQGNEKIGRIIVVEKKGMFGKVLLLKDFKVNMENGEITEVLKN